MSDAELLAYLLRTPCPCGRVCPHDQMATALQERLANAPDRFDENKEKK